MLRIGNHASAIELVAQNNLGKAFGRLNESSQRLSTLKRINSASDDPAGLISAEALKAELVSLEQASRNASRAASTIRVADSGLSQVSDLLNSVRANVLAAAGGNLSPAEQTANQIEIDAALEAINYIGRTTNLGGQRLLDGSSGYRVSNVNAEQFSQVEVTSKAGDAVTNVNVEVLAAATAAQLEITAQEGQLADETTILVRGTEGSATLSFGSGTSLTAVAEAINATSQATGLEASVDEGVLEVTSTAVGSKATAEVEVIAGTVTGAGSATGTDVVAQVNGQQATGDGNEVQFKSDTLQIALTVATNFTGEADTFTVSGDALTFLFSPSPTETASLSLPTINTGRLGSAEGKLSALRTGGTASLSSGNFATAISILDAASDQVVRGRAQAGAFEKFTIESSQAVLARAQENISSALSRVLDTDVAQESARLVQAQILTRAATQSVLLASRQTSLIASLFDNL